MLDRDMSLSDRRRQTPRINTTPRQPYKKKHQHPQPRSLYLKSYRPLFLALLVAALAAACDFLSFLLQAQAQGERASALPSFAYAAGSSGAFSGFRVLGF